jgi:hypothetical protein
MQSLHVPKEYIFPSYIFHKGEEVDMFGVLWLSLLGNFDIWNPDKVNKALYILPMCCRE